MLDCLYLGGVNVNNHNNTVPVVWTSQTADMKPSGKVSSAQPWYQQGDISVGEESVSDVIEAVRGKMEEKEQDIDDDEDDKLELL